MATAIDDDVWSHLTGGSLSQLSAEAAEELLRLRFDDHVHRRVEELSEMAGEGRLNPEERSELERYLDAASLLGVLHIRARGALRRRENQRRNAS